VTVWLVAFAMYLPAQIRELWHRDFTNTYWGPWGGGSDLPTNYFATAVAVDGDGNTLVGGNVDCLPNVSWSGPMLTKLTPSGELAWLYVNPSGGPDGVHTLAVNADGTAYLGTRLVFGPSNWCALIAVDATGQELWRQVETNGAHISRPGSSVRVDGDGNVVWLHFRSVYDETDDYTELHLSKYTPEGESLWELTLPSRHYFLPPHGLANALCLGPDGSSYITGEYHIGDYPADDVSSGFIARVNSAGELLWFTRAVVAEDQVLPFFSSAALGGNGNVCAAGGAGFMVLSGDGELRSFGTLFLSGEIVSATADGGFVLNQHLGIDHLFLSADGRVVWRTPMVVPSSEPDLGTVGDGTGGWLTLRPTYRYGDYGVELVHVDSAGTRLWSARINNWHPLDPWDFVEYRLESVARAPDGTYRLMLNLAMADRYERGFTVSAFAVDEPTNLVKIVRAPGAVSWDGTNEVEFSVVAEGSGPLQYQWCHMDWPVPGATEAVWRIPSNSVPAYRGFVSVQVSDTNGTVLSAGVNLSCGRVWIEPPPADAIATQSFTAMSDVDVPVRVESSTDLVHWGPMAGVFDSYAVGLPVDYNAAAATFFRAVPVPPVGPANGAKAKVRAD